jgi:hypothetical protein
MNLVSNVYTSSATARLLGHVAGYIMARHPTNLERNGWALSLLAMHGNGVFCLNDSRLRRNISCLEARQRLPSQ